MSSYSGMAEEYKQSMKNWIDGNKIKITEVNCDEFIFKKILIGDKSDNIPSVIVWQKEIKGGKLRTYSITEKLADKIYDQYTKEKDSFVIDQLFNSDELDTLSDIVYRVVGKSKKNIIRNKIFENMTLMMLHVNVIPEPIQDQIYKGVEKEFKLLDNIDLSKLINKDKILEGTDWLRVVTPKKYDVFDGLNETKSPKKLKLVGKKKDNKLF